MHRITLTGRTRGRLAGERVVGGHRRIVSDIFVFCARSTEVQPRQIAGALRALAYGVWRDDELPAHRPYAELVDERLAAAKTVLVIWSADAAKSEWV